MYEDAHLEMQYEDRFLIDHDDEFFDDDDDFDPDDEDSMAFAQAFPDEDDGGPF